MARHVPSASFFLLASFAQMQAVAALPHRMLFRPAVCKHSESLVLDKSAAAAAVDLAAPLLASLAHVLASCICAVRSLSAACCLASDSLSSF